MSITEAGTYLGTVTGTALGLTGTGKEQIAIAFDVHLPDGTGSVPMTWYGFFSSDKACEITAKALAALGFDLHKTLLDVLGPEDPAASPLVGATANLVIDWEAPEGDYAGRWRIKWVNRPGGGIAMNERMEPTAAKSFATRMRTKLLAHAGAAPAPAGGQAAQRAPAARPAAPARQASPAAGRPAQGAPRQGTTNDGHEPQDRSGGRDFDDIPF